jgi:perosamine synthetase
LCPSSIPFYAPWITKEDKRAVSEALKSRWLTGGPVARDFENEFAEYVGTKHAVAVNSCTAALHLSMRVLNIKAGDEVIVPVLTFAATANAPIFCGAKPVFVDIDEKTFNISPKDIQEKITHKTKAIICMHYGGQACDMKEISEIARDHKIDVVEDCAHSLGASYNGTMTGNFGKLGCFSFYPTKIITTFEGGMVTTNDAELDRKLRLLREHGMSRTALDRESNATWQYDVVDLGYNYRLSDPQAALGREQLKRVESGIKKRIRIANVYTKLLSERVPVGVVPPYSAPNRSHIYHLYTIKIQAEAAETTRNKVFKELAEDGIQSSVHYTPLHLMTYYKQFLSEKTRVFPVCDRICKEILSLPLYPSLTHRDVARVVARIEKAVRYK